ncbi:hypothetical protein BV25DRAFT_1904546 [Artomyces pyxidatus]|uniref:Uncharacterized protein n=1 Tax=Artomyces pyxidatus TaxID=48021 RepID=A0ACB8TI17_9AGAM|nr:hypothetical protein BV25DRAFT_1904546 [Artomyces pyxidatus]
MSSSLEPSSSDLHLPPSTPYPIKIITIHAQRSAPIERGTRLLTYAFNSSAKPGLPSQVLFGTWDSPVAGTVNKWYFKEQNILNVDQAVLSVTEPCKHGTQFGGLCAWCGKDMTLSDYTGFSDVNRASIQMTHSADGPTVSLEEARRIEQETADDLRKARKLSLIVDLDQTIVHATVDPTVGEWIAEGESWEARHRKKAESTKQSKDDEVDSDSTVSDSDDEVNPNWEALKDVKKFRLGPESFGGHPTRDTLKSKGKEKALENQGCLYYVKPRPGWQEFLSSVATKYEMHVYTMGTRAYAEEVCAAIDPDGKYFGGRLLSRDESGSMTQKSLERLFPVDTSMVVIIDDRADVWDWGPNLIKVIPYDFFVGIGDINSTFLPKVDAAAIPSMPSPSNKPKSNSSPLPPTAPSPLPLDATLAKADEAVEPDNEVDEAVKKDMITRNSLALEAQVEARPLAKLQELQDETDDDEPAPTDTAANGPKPATAESPQRSASPKHHHHRKALLKNDDTELQRVQKLLDDVHKRYFETFDKRRGEKGPKRTINPRTTLQPYDTRDIIVKLRLQTLAGVNVVFSGVISRGTRPQDSDVWHMAIAFGAKCSTDLNSQTTHLVAADRTVKVDKAFDRGGIKIVWLAWFADSIARWERQDETPYLIEGLRGRAATAADTASPSPVLDANQISSDPEPDADDWDVEPGSRNGGADAEQTVPVVTGGEDDDEYEEDEDEDEEVLPLATPTAASVKLVPEELEGDDDELTEAERAVLEEEERNLASVQLDSYEGMTAEELADMQAAMDESDAESDDGNDGRSRGSRGSRSTNVSDDEMNDSRSVGSETSSPQRGKRKRLRSMTPSEVGLNRTGDDDVLRSPLAKRKKIAADRKYSSKLKESISNTELEEPARRPLAAPVFQADNEANIDEDDEDDDDEDEYDDDDDFLARELEEELG